MRLNIPLHINHLELSHEDLESVSCPIFTRQHLQVNEKHFFLDIPGVAKYRVMDGNLVQVYPYPEGDELSVNLFLNGCVLGVLLHQRGILHFHGNSFIYKNKGILLCGNAGVGKSSVATAFCQNGSRFITDDISPVRIEQQSTIILPFNTSVKLWQDTLQKLAIENNGLERVRLELDKFYFPMAETAPEEQRLDHLFILGMHNQEGYEVNELTGMDKYNALRRQIYRRVYLKGMPETEKKYFKQLFQLAAKVRVTQIVRPQICNIYDTMRYIEKEINR